MTLRFICPACQSPIMVRFLKPGEVARCRRCGEFAPVPEDAKKIDSATIPPGAAASAEANGGPPVWIGSASARAKKPATPAEPLSVEEAARLHLARQAVRLGAYAGLLFMILKILKFLILLPISFGRIVVWTDPFMPWDLVVVGALTFGVFRGSRFSCAALLLYYLLNLVAGVELDLMTFAEVELWRFYVSLLFFGSFFLAALVGSTVSNRLRRKAGVAPRDADGVIVMAAALIVVIALPMKLSQVTSYLKKTDSERVQLRSDVDRRTRAFLVGNGLLRRGESISYYYSDDRSDEKKAGEFLTPVRVVRYSKVGEELRVDQARYEDIADIEVVHYPEDGEEGTAVVEITRYGGERFQIEIPTVYGQEKEFFSTMIEFWNLKRRHGNETSTP